MIDAADQESCTEDRVDRWILAPVVRARAATTVDSLAISRRSAPSRDERKDPATNVERKTT